MDDWKLAFAGWKPEEESFREAICTLGNGRFGTRGAAEEARQGGIHGHATYFSGLYGRGEIVLEGRTIRYEDLVNWPDWTHVTFGVDGQWLQPGAMDVLEYLQTLDLARGTLERRFTVRDRHGRETAIRSLRLVSQAEPALAALRWSMTPLNWSGRVRIRSALDGRIVNRDVRRYQGMSGSRFRILSLDAVRHLRLVAESHGSEIRLAMAARNSAWTWDGQAAESGTIAEETELIAEEFDLEARRGHSLRLDKIAALHASKEPALFSPGEAAIESLDRAAGFDALLREHGLAWERLWDCCNIDMDAPGDTRLLLRLHAFHLLQSASVHGLGEDAGLPARGLHGPGYLGHIFWDDFFVLRFLNLRLPEVSRALLMYRCARLPEARARAADEGLRGAVFPWRSGSDGRELTPPFRRNPRTGRWHRDHTCLQRHISAAIALEVWEYHLATGDREFLSAHGAALFLEIARAWADMARPRGETGRFDIPGVVGPDEFHTRVPGAGEPGLPNNAYTNAMAAWVLKTVPDVLDELEGQERDALLERMELGRDELAHWDKVSRRLWIPFHDGVISQFEGYEGLAELDWQGYRARYGDIRRIDDILEAEGDSPDRYKASKQADVLMLLYMLPLGEAEALFRHLGYDLDRSLIRRCMDYYLARTTNGSTLSGVVHAWVRARMDRPASWPLFRDALRFDWSDPVHGSTGEGVHLGAMAGTLDLVQRCYAGLDALRDGLHVDPDLPGSLERLDLEIRYRGARLAFHAGPDGGRLTLVRSAGRPVRVVVEGTRAMELGDGESVGFAVRKEAAMAAGMRHAGKAGTP